MTQNSAAGVSRRRVLTGGIAAGGAIWVAPTITAISLTPANAASPSGPDQEPPDKPDKPNKPPENPPNQPPDDEVDEKPPGSKQPKDKQPDAKPGDKKPDGKPEDEKKPGDKKPDQKRLDDDGEDHIAGDTLPNTGPGNATTAAGIGGALAVGGAAMYVASRRAATDSGESAAS